MRRKLPGTSMLWSNVHFSYRSQEHLLHQLSLPSLGVMRIDAAAYANRMFTSFTS